MLFPDLSKARIVWLATPAIFCLAFPLAARTRADTPAAGASAPKPQTANAAAKAPSDLVDALNTALIGAKSMLNDAQAHRDLALSIISGMPSTPKDADLDADPAKKLNGMAQLLADKRVTAASLKTLEDNLRADANLKTGLPIAQMDLQAAHDAVKPSVIAALPMEDAKTANKTVAEAEKTLKDIADTLSGITDNALGAGVDAARPTKVHDAVQGCYAYAAGLFGLLKARLDATTLPGLATDAKPVAVRSAMVSNLGAEMAVETLRSQMGDAWDKLAPKLKDALAATDQQDRDVMKAEKAVDDQDKAVASHFEPWLTILHKDILAQGETVKTTSLELQAALNKNPRDTEKILAAPALLNATRAVAADVALIVQAMPGLLDVYKNRAFATGRAADLVPLLKTADNTLSTQTALLEDVLSGDREHFVQDQIRLFYFTDVPRLLKALNLEPNRQDPDDQSKLQTKFDNVRKELLDTEADIAGSLAEINAAAQQLRTVQEDLRLATAKLAKADSDAQGAERRLESLNRLNDTLGLSMKSLTTRMEGLNKQKTAADNALSAAQAAAGSAKTDADMRQAAADIAKYTAQSQNLQNQINRTQEGLNQNATQTEQQKKIVMQLMQEQQELAKDKIDLKTQQDTLKAQMASARADLIAKQVARAKARVQAARMADEEVQAFGDLHAHGSFYYTVPVGAATDPVKRVILVGYDDSKVIFIRGLSKDVERVKDIIAGYDRPAPEARVTMWTLQMSGSNLNALNKALKNVENTLRDVRGSIIAVQEVLRDSITEEVNRVAQISLKPMSNNLNWQASNSEKARLARYFFYSREIRQSLGFPFLLQQPGSITYQDGTLPTYLDYASAASLTRWTLPDPAHATTLGEMLFVLSLGKVSSRINILNRFAQELNRLYPNNGQPDLPTVNASARVQRQQRIDFAKAFASYSQMQTKGQTKSSPDGVQPGNSKQSIIIEKDYDDTDDAIEMPADTKSPPTYPAFPRTILGIVFASPSQDPNAKTPFNIPNNGLNANQLEILSALQSKARAAVTAEISRLLHQIDGLEVRSEDYISKLQASDLSEINRRYGSVESKLLREQYLPLLGWLYAKLFRPNGSKQEDSQTYYKMGIGAAGIQANLDPATLLAWIPSSHGDAATLAKAQDNLRDLDKAALNIINIARQRNSLAEATPRVAAADDMIKRMIIVAEDDLDYFFVEPALDQLRKLANSDVQLGVINRESMLVTNRQISRIDPRANASLNLPGGTDYLQEAQQLGQIVTGIQDNQRFRNAQRAEKLSTTLPLLGGGIASRLGETTANAFAIGGLLSLFGDLAAKPQEPAGEIYSINTGSLFQITPIFDPSGQALRFNLNYQAGTRIQEPLGTTNPDLPNVERFSLNTDVQISNLEFREVARYGANAKVGLPEQRSGGFPLVKELPFFRDIPLLGYFFRRKASAAVRQESILFAQTSMYPTIGDIVDVLSDVPLRFDLNPEAPDYLKPVPEKSVSLPPPPPSSGVLSALALEQPAVLVGDTTLGTVTFSAPVSENTTVHLHSEDTSIVELPADEVVVPKGQTSAMFIVKTHQPSDAQARQASGTGGASGANPPQSAGTPEAQKPVQAAKPPSVTGKPGVNSPSGTVGTSAKPQSDPKTQSSFVPRAFAITATTNDKITKIALLQVQKELKTPPAVPLPDVAELTFAPAAVVGGQDVHAIVTLAAKAPAGGAKVNLTINGPAGLQLSQKSITVTEGYQTAEFSIHTVPVDRLTSVIVTATTGKAFNTKAFVLMPPSLQTVTVTTKDGGQTFTLTAILNGKAASPVDVTFSASDPYLSFREIRQVPTNGDRIVYVVRQQKPLPLYSVALTVRAQVTANNVTRAVEIPLHH